MIWCPRQSASSCQQSSPLTQSDLPGHNSPTPHVVRGDLARADVEVTHVTVRAASVYVVLVYQNAGHRIIEVLAELCKGQETSISVVFLCFISQKRIVPSAEPLTTTLSSWFQWTVLTLCLSRVYRVVACELLQCLSRHNIPHEDRLVTSDGGYSAVVRRAVFTIVTYMAKSRTSWLWMPVYFLISLPFEGFQICI